MNDAPKREFFCQHCGTMMVDLVPDSPLACPSCEEHGHSATYSVMLMRPAAWFQILIRRLTDAWEVLRGRRYTLKFPGDHLFPVATRYRYPPQLTEKSNSIYID